MTGGGMLQAYVGGLAQVAALPCPPWLLVVGGAPAGQGLAVGLQLCAPDGADDRAQAAFLEGVIARLKEHRDALMFKGGGLVVARAMPGE